MRLLNVLENKIIYTSLSWRDTPRLSYVIKSIKFSVIKCVKKKK